MQIANRLVRVVAIHNVNNQTAEQTRYGLEFT